jgi:hypothetical protein
MGAGGGESCSIITLKNQAQAGVLRRQSIIIAGEDFGVASEAFRAATERVKRGAHAGGPPPLAPSEAAGVKGKIGIRVRPGQRIVDFKRSKLRRAAGPARALGANHPGAHHGVRGRGAIVRDLGGLDGGAQAGGWTASARRRTGHRVRADGRQVEIKTVLMRTVTPVAGLPVTAGGVFNCGAAVKTLN